MKTQATFVIGAAAAVIGLAAAGPLQASTLSKIGHAIAYPVKKAAGNGSKSANKGGKALVYPVRKAGVNTSKTAHKATGQH